MTSSMQKSIGVVVCPGTCVRRIVSNCFRKEEQFVHGRLGGRMVLRDFQPGPYKSVLGRLSRAVIFAVEFLAGGDPFRIQLQFMAPGGPPTLAADNGFGIEEQRLLFGGARAAACLVPR